MAITLDVKMPCGIAAKKSYCRVESVALVTKDSINFNLRFYINSTAQIAFDEKNFTAPYDLEKSNPILQAYDFLKTLPEFSSAIDA
jgi:hypothetical protein